MKIIIKALIASIVITFVEMMSRIQAVIAVLSFAAISRIQAGSHDVVSGELSSPTFLNKINRESAADSRSGSVDKWITQKLDHFNDIDYRTWHMRYLSDNRYFVEGAPIFIFIGGNWEISKGSLTDLHMWDIAREHQGYIFYTEHRYYGKSLPTVDLSTDNLKYLTAKQALADLAHFIRTKKAEIRGLENSKVIVFGAGYSASLVVWLKRLYPDLVIGGSASSASLQAKMEFFEYREAVGKSIQSLGDWQCLNRIRNGIAGLESIFETNRYSEAKLILNLCDNFDDKNDLDMASLFSMIADKFASLVEHPVPGQMPQICNFIMQFLDDVAGVVNFFRLNFGWETCVDASYKYLTEEIINTTSIAGTRQWYYQLCNEFGWFHTSGSRNQPFGNKFPITFFIKMCTDAFGKEHSNYIQQDVEQTNKFFGGVHHGVENVYITQGELDPWRQMGPQAEHGATIISRVSHNADLKSIKPTDSPALKDSKLIIKELVRKWIESDQVMPNA